jgi:(R,R)-butanediol dehydrogenase/meso-butanediol dehydrogenase/diacetyl reductase
VCLRKPPPDHFDGRGAYCRSVVAPASRLLRIPAGLDVRAAALTEPTAIALHTLTLSGAQPDDRVLVSGGGPVGQLTLAVLRAHGVEDVTVVEPAPARRSRAVELGAARVLAPDELPRAPMGHPVESPFTLAFECSGNARAAEAALDQLDYAGTMLFVGTGHELPRVNHNRAIVLELTIIGAYNYDAHGFEDALALLASGRLPLDLLIEPADAVLDSLDAAMARLAAGELAGKVMVRPETALTAEGMGA